MDIFRSMIHNFIKSLSERPIIGSLLPVSVGLFSWMAELFVVLNPILQGLTFIIGIGVGILTLLLKWKDVLKSRKRKNSPNQFDL